MAGNPDVEQQLRADLASARAELAKLRDENVSLGDQAQTRPAAGEAAQPRTQVTQLEAENGDLVDHFHAPAIAERLERVRDHVAFLRTVMERLHADNARLTQELAARATPPPAGPPVVEVPVPDPALVEQLRAIRRDWGTHMDTVIATAHVLRGLLGQADQALPPAPAPPDRATRDRTDRAFTLGEHVHLDAGGAPWHVTKVWQSVDSWVMLQHSVHTDQIRSIRTRVLAKHQHSLARSDPGSRPQDTFGARIRVLRVERGLTQAELATLAGLPPAVQRNLENGHRRAITLDTIHRLATALDVDATDMFRPPATGDPAP
ncbi:helix-turn-helix domain-containing protein [Jiangella alkaliphila]|uniref:helix-turn-helix domain-containing protein n=1 Tax=Jiangella alkaliphila TaxID=419479 RepID=UPI00136496C7|nr:helix-turn-helix transcriptional regulator [Jiangella alkaliphila]